ncbi:MAG: aminotransferase class V-fold PLP-dependent enzyme [Clostridia bacterium]|nr:aminotransferase class V-fold PLP-dependent enzyme [Clostridia bacterium]
MNTPICDFVKKYNDSNFHRLHMPGHKGAPLLGFEQYDITEIKGADALYEANGIIKESEDNASSLFGCPTFYSTEGSSQCIRAMLYIAKLLGRNKILAGRNAHKAFITAAALLDLEVEWIFSNASYLSCEISKEGLEQEIIKHRPGAVYITSPDYLGGTSDINAISEICKKHKVLLLVDCAHGAYFKFLPESLFPVDLGADMCCASAHKTLPCLTGGAYLHIKDEALASYAKMALALFGSTSPSFLILQSLDKVNEYLSLGFKDKLSALILKAERMKKVLRSKGYTLYEAEPLKITLCTKAYGYTGIEFAEILRSKSIECEFADPDFTVLMIGITSNLDYLEKALLSITPLAPITVFPPKIEKPQRALSIRQAIMSKNKKAVINEAQGNALASLSLSCPPAVPILVCGEVISENAVKCFEYYGIEEIEIVSE